MNGDHPKSEAVSSKTVTRCVQVDRICEGAHRCILPAAAERHLHIWGSVPEAEETTAWQPPAELTSAFTAAEWASVGLLDKLVPLADYDRLQSRLAELERFNVGLATESEQRRVALSVAYEWMGDVEPLYRPHGSPEYLLARETVEKVLADLPSETSGSLPGDGTRRTAFNAWWREMWKDNDPRSSPGFDEQMRSWSLDAWQAGAAHERDRIAAMRAPETPPSKAPETCGGQEAARLRHAIRKIRAHTAYRPGATREFLAELLSSIARIASTAWHDFDDVKPDAEAALNAEHPWRAEIERLRALCAESQALMSEDFPERAEDLDRACASPRYLTHYKALLRELSDSPSKASGEPT